MSTATDSQGRTSPAGAAVGMSLLDALADAGAAMERVLGLLDDAVAWRSTDRDVLTAVTCLASLRATAEAVHLRLVAQVDERGVAEASPVATSPEGFLRTATASTAGQARADVAAARATRTGGVLAPLGALLATGRCGRAQLDAAVKVLDRIPTSLLERPGAAEKVCDYLRIAVADATATQVKQAGAQLLAILAPDPADRDDCAPWRERDTDPDHDPQRAHERRFLDIATDATGMTVGQFQLDPVTGALLRAAVSRWSGPVSGGESAEPGERDRRQPRQRRADALAFLLQTAMAVEHPRRGERPRVVVQVTPEQLAGVPGAGLADVEGVGPVPRWAMRRLSCDAVLQRVVDSPSRGPLDLGREVRLATNDQRRVLAGRDGGCVVPGCGAPPEVCDVHHIVHWADGGTTDVRTMCLACPGHHTAIHAGTWQVTIDGSQQVFVTPPAWVDRTRTPRPAWYQHARRLAEELRRTSPDQASPDPPTTGSPPDEVWDRVLAADDERRRRMRHVVLDGRDLLDRRVTLSAAPG
jgi:hypothetical protein